VSDPAISFRDVYRRFGDHDVLRGLTFDVQPGSVYALLGRNGSGKTTAIRTLLGFLEPHHGSARVLGRDSRCLGPADRARVGYVTEGHRLYGVMTVEGILQFEAGTRPDFSLGRALDAVKRFGLRPGQRIRRLSRGQRAQVALICAVAADPEVLVFDDPAMGLDVVMRREFLDVMIDLLSDRGCSVLLSSHILTDVERIADRIGILHGGRLIVDASMDDLKRRVVQCFWRPAKAGEPPKVPGLLRARRRADGHDLTLLDCLPSTREKLTSDGARLSEPETPTLEELFLTLVSKVPVGPGAALAAEVPA